MEDTYVALLVDHDIRLVVEVAGPFVAGHDADRFVALRSRDTDTRGTWVTRPLNSPGEWDDWTEAEALERHLRETP